MIRPLALAALMAGFASSLLAGSSPQSGRTTPTTNWSQPIEAGVAWDSGTYAYDGSGNIARIGLDAFGYDGTNRLTSGTVNAYGVATTQAFVYDRFGNMLQIATTPDYGGDFPVPTETTELEVDGDTNRLSSACHPVHGCETWTYDTATGNLTSNHKSGGTPVYNVTYGWDPTGTMTELTGGSAHERYVYDANDERIIMVSLDGNSEVIRRWTWRDASNKVAREVVENVGADVWSEARDNVYRNGTLLAAYTSATATVADRHYHVDHLGTPRLITDAARHKVAIEAYLPFGERAPGSELPYVGFKDRMRFTGHERDGEGSVYRPSLDYMHARYYTPEWGRFLSVDPTWDSADLRRPQNWNRYSYAYDNPLRYTDPDGRIAIADDVVIGLVIATIAITVYVEAPSIAVPGKTNGQVLVQTGIDGFQALGKLLLDGSSGGGADEMAAQGAADAWRRQQEAKLDLSPIQSSSEGGGGRTDRKLDKNTRAHGQDKVDKLRGELKQLQSTPNKTPQVKEQIQAKERELKRATDQQRKSEEHARAKQR